MLKENSVKIYMLLGGLFVAFLVVCNLIASKFITVDLGFYTFKISAGVLPYPITFLITDILSEFYGRRKTFFVVVTGLLASVFVVITLNVADSFSALPNSPVDDVLFHKVFGNSWRVITASMVAYLSAQLVDVQLYEFWKKKTGGKYLWIRNNFSTMFSQLVDTILVVLVLFYGEMPLNEMFLLILHGWFFKVICAAFDTPIMYLVVWKLRDYFNLAPGEEVEF